MSISPLVQTVYDFAGQVAVAATVATKDEVANLQGFFGYADREGFLGSIATLLHRVWNAVKALFGQSDWQRAERALSSIAGNVVDLFCEEGEAARRQKAEISKGLDAKEAKFLIDMINQVNSDAKKVEAFALPLLNVLLPNIDLERVVPDLIDGTIPAVLNDIGRKPAQEKMFALLAFVAEKGYIKPAGMEVIGQIPTLLASLAAQAGQEPHSPDEGEL